MEWFTIPFLVGVHNSFRYKECIFIISTSLELVSYRFTIKEQGPDCIGVYEANIPCSSCSSSTEEVKEYAYLEAAGPIEPPFDFYGIIDEPTQTIQIQSSSRISEPKAIITHLPNAGSKPEDSTRFGYICGLHGKPPFYGLLNS